MAWFDGVDRMLGSNGNVQDDYDELTTYLDARLAFPTDVTVDLSAEQVQDETYLVTATVSLEADGEAKTVRVHIVDTLYNYPTDDDQYSYCVRQGFEVGDYDLTPGQTIEVQQEITFKSESWARPEDIQLVAFAQTPEDHADAEVHQAARLLWPFPTECPQDVNGDQVVNIDDVFAVLGAWGACDDCPEDVDESGNVDIDDLFEVLGHWGPC